MSDQQREDDIYSVNQTFKGHGLWQFEDFLKDNQQQYSIKELSRVKQKEVKASFSGEEEETVEFELTLMSDGSSVKANFTTIPAKGKGGEKGSVFKLNMGKLHTEAQAREAFTKFHAVTTDFLLKNLPANAPLHIFTAFGNSRWQELGNELKIQAILERADKFRERGIEVHLNDRLIVGLKPEDDFKNPKSLTKKPKPWETPKLTRER